MTIIRHRMVRGGSPLVAGCGRNRNKHLFFVFKRIPSYRDCVREKKYIYHIIRTYITSSTIVFVCKLVEPKDE